MRITDFIYTCRTKRHINNDYYLSKSSIGSWMIAVQMMAFIAIILVVLKLCTQGDFLEYLFAILKISTPPHESPSCGHWVAYFIMGVAATLLIPFLTAAISNGVHQKETIIKEGRKVYKHIKNHYVLIGYNQFGRQIIEQLLRENTYYAIIMTTQNPVKLRDTLDNELVKSISKRVVIYAGDAIVPENISKLNLRYAQKLYLLDESDSSASQYTRNLSVLKNVVKEVSEGERKPLEVYMQVNNGKAYNLLQRVDVPIEFFKNVKGEVVVDFRPFNFYENWARLLWSYYKLPQYDSLDFEPLENTNKHVHLVISGFNSMGRALFLEALRLCHYPNFEEKTGKNKTVISVFDSKWAEMKGSFYTQYPYLEQIADIKIEFNSYDIDHPDARHYLDQWAKDDNQLLTIAICNKEPDIAMTKAVNLPEAVYYQKDKFDSVKKENLNPVRVLVRQEMETVTKDIFLHDNIKAYPHVKFFGMLQNGVDMKQLDDRIAICINGIYDFYKSQPANLSNMNELLDCQQRIEKTITVKNEAEWTKNWLQKTIQCDKWSCRYQSDMFKTYIDTWARHKNLSIKEFELWQEILSDMEHRRWMAERSIYGFRQVNAGEGKDKTLKLHDNVIPYKDLDEGTKTYDRNIVNTAAMIVHQLEKI